MIPHAVMAAKAHHPNPPCYVQHSATLLPFTGVCGERSFLGSVLGYVCFWDAQTREGCRVQTVPRTTTYHSGFHFLFHDPNINPIYYSSFRFLFRYLHLQFNPSPRPQRPETPRPESWKPLTGKSRRFRLHRFRVQRFVL